MDNEFYVITGVSRGIGRALAEKALREGQTVLGVARGRPEGLSSDRYHHLSVDLSDATAVGRIMDQVDRICGEQHFDYVCLVNNASASDPLGPIEKCPPDEIEAHLRIGLLAPALLTSRFIGRFAAASLRKKVAFISSGLAFKPMADQSIYCTAKAGLHMFGQCIGLEQADAAAAFEIISIGPGMVDTSMQQTIRSKSSADFAMAGYFQQAHQDGKLQDPAAVADKIYTILANRYEQGRYISVSDV